LQKLWSDAVEDRIRAEGRNLDPQKVPTEVQMCTRCVMTNQRPRITFDEEGVCSACRFAEQKAKIDWDARRLALRDLLAKHRRSSGYDVIVPCSGGKDSSFVAHTLKTEYEMTPLCIKFAPFLYTDIGRRNFENFAQYGFDTLEFRPNGLIHRKLARLAFEFYGDPFQPFVYGQLAFPMRMSVQLGIPLVFYGENGEAEYGGDQSANDKPCWDFDKWNEVYTKGAPIGKLVNMGCHLGAFSEQEERAISDFYRMPRFSDMLSVGTEFHWLGYYYRWHPQGNYYHAAEHCGFEANEERSEGTYSKYASLDDKLDGLHYYMAYVKFGIGRCTSDAAHEVRDGDLEREEALSLVQKYDGEFPTKYLKECLEYLGMDSEHMGTVIERFRGNA
jgi:N-acetyl sugar amidotransferase